MTNGAGPASDPDHATRLAAELAELQIRERRLRVAFAVVFVIAVVAALV